MLAIAREAIFRGVPAIGLSRTKGAATGEAEIDAHAMLVDCLWLSRSQWLVESGWFSVNLPKVLPAPIAAARIGHDKIGNVADVVRQ